MSLRLLIAAALLAGTAPAAAQQAQDAPEVPVSDRAAEVPPTKLASADEVHLPKGDEPRPADAPGKKRVARATTCRCGDVPNP